MNHQQIDETLFALFENGDVKVVYPDNFMDLVRDKITLGHIERKERLQSLNRDNESADVLSEDEIRTNAEKEAVEALNHFQAQLNGKIYSSVRELLQESIWFTSSDSRWKDERPEDVENLTKLLPLIQHYCLRPTIIRHYKLFPGYKEERISPPEGASDYEWLHHISSAIVKDIAPWTYNYHDVTWLYFHWFRQLFRSEGEESQAFLLAEEATQFIWEHIYQAIHWAVISLVFYGGMVGLQRCKEKFGEFANEDSELTVKETEIFVKDLTMIWIKSLPLRFKRGRSKKTNVDNLFVRYNEVIGIWKEAYQICRSALSSLSPQRKQGWQKYILELFDFLPPDLVERLQPLADWPDEASKKCSEKGGEDDPEDIALEHAARLCGASDYDYQLSTLREYLNRQARKN